MSDTHFYGTGRRKTSTARVFLRPGTTAEGGSGGRPTPRGNKRRADPRRHGHEAARGPAGAGGLF